ncbi:MAG: GrpB family protein [Actinobacteria bacterium]|nr:GrpB family protein [Actinomycetota bacterium]
MDEHPRVGDALRLSFFPSHLVAEEAAAVFAEHERRIRERLPDVEIRHTGGTSVLGVLTAGDVDLQVRTDRESFEAARDALGELYEPHHADVWHPEGAFFVASDSEPRVEVALTVIGSLDDLHHGEAWQQMAADPGLIERYNAFKRAYEGGSYDEYQAAKRDFFYANFRL